MRVYSDDFKRIYDPSYKENSKWYVNDHTIIKDENGWHLFGITHEEPAAPLEEILCAYAFTKDILSAPFVKQPIPFKAEKTEKELHFWAPHIIKHGGIFHMFYCAGSLEGHDKYRIHLALSNDLHTWVRHPENPMLIDGFDARDPMVLRLENEWVMYYTCNTSSSGGKHCVACVTSDDLIHWKNKREVFVSKTEGTYGGPCESPFVEKVGDTYFLFIGPYGIKQGLYSDTAVYASKDPFCFGGEPVGRIPSHAAEVIKIEGNYYITHCGWGQDGVYLAPLHFEI
jgi:hypothetical protein